ncbi:uncharacterized protein LOC134167449 isoform X2 [Pezoporus occidentalis]|uniref:uncharacterized protein LOC134167449 isoform X2 n=1 Tax=Pezoporus occidentalis TaxID=407982 RepID=UPI002F91084F
MRATLTGIWLLIEDCSLIIQPGCGRHRRGQEEQNQEDAEALEAAELPEGVQRQSGDGPYSCGGGRLCGMARSGRGCTSRDTRRRLPHWRPRTHPLSWTSPMAVSLAQLEAPPARGGRQRRCRGMWRRPEGRRWGAAGRRRQPARTGGRSAQYGRSGVGNNVDSQPCAVSRPEEAPSPQTQGLLTGGRLQGEIRQWETPAVSPPCVNWWRHGSQSPARYGWPGKHLNVDT